MRDIRGDLQERANTIKEQMSAAHNRFEKRFEQLKLEHQAKKSCSRTGSRKACHDDRVSPAGSATGS
jgi:hypothetical protein